VQLGYPISSGRGIGDDLGWPTEERLLILGIDKGHALALVRRFGQNAIFKSGFCQTNSFI
jgi:hypothetical protein